MTPRQRYLETLLFGRPDRVPLEPGFGRRSTLAAWHTQGLPGDVRDYIEYAYHRVGGKLPSPSRGPAFHASARMIPQFEEKVIERREATQIVQDWKGNICEIGNEYGVEDLRSAVDFVTRRWIECPVKNGADWERMKSRYDPDDPARLPADAQALGACLSQRDYPVELDLPGIFWQLREWVGFEQLCTLFYDDPGFVQEMVAFWGDFIARLLETVFRHFVPDHIHISEDMAYKEHSMISPDMVRKYLLPTYTRWGEIIHRAGCPLYGVDSDGYLGQLIPIYIEAGMNVCDPIEVAAGNDPVAFRRSFGAKMAYRGGVDKRAIAKGGKVIEAEIDRLKPVIADGGYIPGCDHAVPADVAWPDYVHYLRLLAKITGWL